MEEYANAGTEYSRIIKWETYEEFYLREKLLGTKVALIREKWTTCLGNPGITCKKDQATGEWMLGIFAGAETKEYDKSGACVAQRATGSASSQSQHAELRDEAKSTFDQVRCLRDRCMALRRRRSTSLSRIASCSTLLSPWCPTTPVRSNRRP